MALKPPPARSARGLTNVVGMALAEKLRTRNLIRTSGKTDLSIVDHHTYVLRRNLMGQVEATHFPAPGSEQFATVVWIDDGPDWVVGGTVLVLRRIRMLLESGTSSTVPCRRPSWAAACPPAHMI